MLVTRTLSCLTHHTHTVMLYTSHTCSHHIHAQPNAHITYMLPSRTSSHTCSHTCSCSRAHIAHCDACHMLACHVCRGRTLTMAAPHKPCSMPPPDLCHCIILDRRQQIPPSSTSLLRQLVYPVPSAKNLSRSQNFPDPRTEHSCELPSRANSTDTPFASQPDLDLLEDDLSAADKSFLSLEKPERAAFLVTEARR